jgi:hypothetical protein
MLDAEDDSELEHRFRTLQNVLGDGLDTEPDEELHFLATEVPGSFSEAKSDANRRRATEEEMEAIEENSSWRLTTLPPGHHVIGLKWVYKVKKDAHGAVHKHKARLVAKVYVQHHGINYNKFFAPMAQLELVRLLLALATSAGWDIHHMDVK